MKYLLVLVWLHLAIAVKAESQGQALGQTPITVLAWTDQVAPVLAIIQVQKQCLVIAVPGSPPYTHPLLVKTAKGPGYTVSTDSTLQTPHALIHQYSIGLWRLATATPGWLDTLAQDFAPNRLSGPPCVASKSLPLQLTNQSLTAIRQSHLVKDTLEKLTGPLIRPLGLKGQAINGSHHHELAGYAPSRDSIFLDARVIPSLMHLRYALLHEFGHRYVRQFPGVLVKYTPRPFRPSLVHPNIVEYQADLVAHAIAWNSFKRSLTPDQVQIWSHLFNSQMPRVVELAAQLFP